ncbi:MAG: DUF4364 family protein [Planctomycetia bacterium]|nr:DUF4364 family protein [Planctomycetia bacterium]
MATTKTDKTATLSGNKILVLETLAKAKDGMTRAQLSKATEIQKGWAKLLGAVTLGEPAEGTLEGDGYVKSAEVEGVRGLVYTITAKGKKALADAQDVAKAEGK